MGNAPWDQLEQQYLNRDIDVLRGVLGEDFQGLYDAGMTLTIDAIVDLTGAKRRAVLGDVDDESR